MQSKNRQLASLVCHTGSESKRNNGNKTIQTDERYKSEKNSLSMFIYVYTCITVYFYRGSKKPVFLKKFFLGFIGFWVFRIFF